MNKPLLHQGIDKHRFDANAPERIQQALDEGRIKPFEKTVNQSENDVYET